jgi:hypothetical protein
VGFDAPAQERQRSNGAPSVSVFLIPPNQPGTLEGYIEPALRAVAAVNAAHSDHFAGLVATRWNPAQRQKLWARAMFAAEHRPDPCIGIGSALLLPSFEPVLLHQSLNGLATYIGTM